MSAKKKSSKLREDWAHAGSSVRRRIEYAQRVKDPVRIVPVCSAGALLVRDVDPDTRAQIDEFLAKKKGDAK